MKNTLLWFTHDGDARNHPKMKALRGAFGVAGYGLYWMLNEIISSSPDARLDLSKKINRLSVASELGLSADEFEKFMAFLSDPDIDLVNMDDSGIVTTDRTQEDYKRVSEERLRKSQRSKKTTPTDAEPTMEDAASLEVDETPRKNDDFPGKIDKIPRKKHTQNSTEEKKEEIKKSARSDSEKQEERPEAKPKFQAQLYQALIAADGFFIPGESENFLAVFPHEIAPFIVGIPESDILAAVGNLGKIAQAPVGKYFWDGNVTPRSFFEKHLARFLPGQFHESDFEPKRAKTNFTCRKERAPETQRPEIRYPDMKGPESVSDSDRAAIDKATGGDWLSTFRKVAEKRVQA